MSRPWFRMYSEWVADPKVQLLAFEDQRHFVALLCLKCNGTADSNVSSELRERMLAKALGLDPASAAEAKRRLVEAGLIDDDWQPVKWNSRQFESDSSTSRVHKWRLKHNETLQKQSSNDPVTEMHRSRSEQNRTEQIKKPARGTRLPDDFGLTEERRKAGTDAGINVELEFAKFCDHWRAQPGAKGVKVDWDAVWRNWCRSDYAKRSESSGGVKWG